MQMTSLSKHKLFLEQLEVGFVEIKETGACILNISYTLLKHNRPHMTQYAGFA